MAGLQRTLPIDASTGFQPIPGRRGFTLIEVLVVISVIGVLVSLLLPAVQSVREAARRSQCQDHLHNLVTGLMNYESAHKVLPPGSMSQGSSFPQQSGWGWGAMILPYIEQSPLHNQIVFEQENTVGSNRDLLKISLPVWVCPSSVAPVQILVERDLQPEILLATGNYPGLDAVLSAMSSTRLAHVTDGVSNTLFVGENQFQEGELGLNSYTSTWVGKVAYPNDYAPHAIPHMGASELTRINKSPGFAGAFGSQHPGGAQFAFGDGSVDFLSENMSIEVFSAYGTAAGGEPYSR